MTATDSNMLAIDRLMAAIAASAWFGDLMPEGATANEHVYFETINDNSGTPNGYEAHLATLRPYAIVCPENDFVVTVTAQRQHLDSGSALVILEVDVPTDLAGCANWSEAHRWMYEHVCGIMTDLAESDETAWREIRLFDRVHYASPAEARSSRPTMIGTFIVKWGMK